MADIIELKKMRNTFTEKLDEMVADLYESYKMLDDRDASMMLTLRRMHDLYESRNKLYTMYDDLFDMMIKAYATTDTVTGFLDREEEEEDENED